MKMHYWSSKFSFMRMAVSLLSAFAADGVFAQEYGFSAPAFSPTGRYISLNYCKTHNKPNTCEGIYYDRERARFFEFRDAGGMRVVDIAFSPKGTQAAFFLASGPGEDSGPGRIYCVAVLDLASHHYRRGPCGVGERRYPAFVGEEKVAYFVADVPKKAGSRPGKWLYVTDTASMKEREVSTERFFGPSAPRARPIGEEVVFSDYGYVSGQRLKRDLRFSKEGPADDVLVASIASGEIGLLKAGQAGLVGPRVAGRTGRIFAMERQSSTVEQSYVHDVVALHDDTVSYVARVGKYVWGMDVSPDERWLALVVRSDDRRIWNGQFWLLDTRTNELSVLVPEVIERINVTEMCRPGADSKMGFCSN